MRRYRNRWRRSSLCRLFESYEGSVNMTTRRRVPLPTWGDPLELTRSHNGPQVMNSFSDPPHRFRNVVRLVKPPDTNPDRRIRFLLGQP